MSEYDVRKNSDGSYTVSEHSEPGCMTSIGVIVLVAIIGGIMTLFSHGETNKSETPDSSYQQPSVTLEPSIVDTTEPKPLNALKFIDTEWGSGEGNYRPDEVYDLYGNGYKGYFDLAAVNRTYADYEEEAYVRLAAQGQWKYLKGTYFPRDWEFGDYYVHLCIYADDELVYQSEWMERESKAASFDIDIHNCQVIKLSVTGQETDQFPNITPGIVVVLATVYN